MLMVFSGKQYLILYSVQNTILTWGKNTQHIHNQHKILNISTEKNFPITLFLGVLEKLKKV